VIDNWQAWLYHSSMASADLTAPPATPGAPAPCSDAAPPSVPGATYDDVIDLLTDMSERIRKIERFVDDAQTAINNMPSLPFMPKFPKVGKVNGGDHV
jgi:hypothetical protein